MINQELCVVKYFYWTTLVFQQNVVQRHALKQLDVSGSFQASVSILVNLVQANVDVNSPNTSTVVVIDSKINVTTPSGFILFVLPLKC